jgi:hypothetical protein
MAIFEILADGFKKVEETSFCTAGIGERTDLQRLLRTNVAVVSPGTLVISEEFGEGEDSRRRIDLLGIGKDANLVVIELKRSEDGGHMDLQAIRYAAMVSAMTFERAIDVYSEYLGRIGSDLDPLASILEFLEWDEPDEDSFGQNVRLLLAAADFSKELTTAVMWLNEQGLDIRCVRIKPYVYGEKILADVQQVIPLPEAEDYRVRIKEKQQRERAAHKFNPDFTKYDVTIDGKTHSRLSKRGAIYTVVKFLSDSGISSEAIAAQVPWRKNSMFRSADGTLDSAAFVQRMRQDEEGGGKRFEERRFYYADDELIHSGGRTYAFTNQWGNRTISAINNLIQAFPQHQITCNKSENEA